MAIPSFVFCLSLVRLGCTILGDPLVKGGISSLLVKGGISSPLSLFSLAKASLCNSSASGAHCIVLRSHMIGFGFMVYFTRRLHYSPYFVAGWGEGWGFPALKTPTLTPPLPPPIPLSCC
jgi:hypothetical protein